MDPGLFVRWNHLRTKNLRLLYRLYKSEKLRKFYKSLHRHSTTCNMNMFAKMSDSMAPRLTPDNSIAPLWSISV